MLPPSADIVVIGGGVIGSSVAYHLSKRERSVLLLEKDGLVSGTSGACDGLVYLQPKRPGAHSRLAMESRKRFDVLQHELDVDIEFRSQGGMIVVETQEELDAMRLFVGDQKELPILGPVPGAEGLFIATGHEGDGIALSPVTGWIIAEWIVEGSPGMDVSSFSPGRFMSPPN